MRITLRFWFFIHYDNLKIEYAVVERFTILARTDVGIVAEGAAAIVQVVTGTPVHPVGMVIVQALVVPVLINEISKQVFTGGATPLFREVQ